MKLNKKLFSYSMLKTHLENNVAREARLVNTNHRYSKAANKKIKTKKQSRRHENCEIINNI